MDNLQNKIWRSFSLLENWITENGWSGFDPYDVKANKYVIKLTELGNKNRFFEITREAAFETFLLFPKFTRKLFGIRPSINAKAMALFSSSYLDLFIKSGDKRYLSKSEESLSWLENNLVKYSSGIGWGYPFDWQSKKLIPANTPNGIVTTAVGDAFWKMYLHTNEKKYLNTCISICNFLFELPKDNISKNQLCFSYTPIFINHVHNLNLFVAEFLLKVGKEVNNLEWINTALKAVNYTLVNQFTDGSFDYDGPPEKLRNFRDNYHTGYVLRMLYSIWKLTGEKRVYDSIKKCFNHYINNFFINKTIPKFNPTNIYRIDIHSCSESIICLLTLKDDFPEGIQIANNVLNWTIENLQDKDGYFYHGIFKSRLGLTFKSKFPYLRWAQAWMLKAFSFILDFRNQQHDR